jgi:hypothetical protein
LPTIKNQNTKKRGKTKNKMEGPMSKNTNEPRERTNHKGNIKFPNPLPSQKNISNTKRGRPLVRSSNKPSFTTCLKIKNACA